MLRTVAMPAGTPTLPDTCCIHQEGWPPSLTPPTTIIKALPMKFQRIHHDTSTILHIRLLSIIEITSCRRDYFLVSVLWEVARIGGIFSQPVNWVCQENQSRRCRCYVMRCSISLGHSRHWNISCPSHFPCAPSSPSLTACTITMPLHNTSYYLCISLFVWISPKPTSHFTHT